MINNYLNDDIEANDFEKQIIKDLVMEIKSLENELKSADKKNRRVAVIMFLKKTQYRIQQVSPYIASLLVISALNLAFDDQSIIQTIISLNPVHIFQALSWIIEIGLTHFFVMGYREDYSTFDYYSKVYEAEQKYSSVDKEEIQSLLELKKDNYKVLTRG